MFAERLCQGGGNDIHTGHVTKMHMKQKGSILLMFVCFLSHPTEASVSFYNLLKLDENFCSLLFSLDNKILFLGNSFRTLVKMQAAFISVPRFIKIYKHMLI